MHQYEKSARLEDEGMLKHVFEAFKQARLKIIYSATDTEDLSRVMRKPTF